jgi:NRPS condensation-like uncharacterized protein
MMTEQILRKLINNERKFLLTPAANVAVVARIKGNVNYYALEKAINGIKEKHPLITSRVKTEKNTKFFVKDPTLQIPLKSIARNSDADWIDVIKQENLTPFDHSNGPLIRFILIYSPDVSEIITYCQHAICDGTALAFLLRDILMVMSEPDASLEEISPDFKITDILGKNQGGVEQKIKSIFVNRINNRWRKKRVTFDYEDYLTIHKVFNNKNEYCAVPIEIDEIQTKQIIERCRNHGVTINSALTGALIKAYQEVLNSNGEKKLKIAMPFDLRRRTDPPLDDVFCLLVGSIEAAFKSSSRLSFWDNVKMIHKEIKSKIERKEVFESALMIEELDPTLADVIISFAPLSKEVTSDYKNYEKLSRFAADKKNPAIDIASQFSDSLPNIINTNLGRLDFSSKFGQYEIDNMFFAPPGSMNVPLVAGFLGVNGKITGTLSYFKPRYEVNDSRGKEMLIIRDKILEYLEIDSE